jgi:hypothetical protein
VFIGTIAATITRRITTICITIAAEQAEIAERNRPVQAGLFLWDTV